MGVWLYGVLLALQVLAIGWVAVRLLGGWLRQRRRPRNELLMRRSAGELVRLILEEEDRAIPLEMAVDGARLMVELCGRIGAALYGYPPATMAQHLVHLGVYQRLLRQAERRRGLHRALVLKRLSDLPPQVEVESRVRPFLRDSSREVRFAALLVLLAAVPQESLRLIAEFDEPLTACEVGEVLHQMRRTLLPIAYRPLMESHHQNLQRLGLCLVHQFAVEDADELLLGLVASSPDRELAMASLYVLCALHRPLRRRYLKHCLEQLSSSERRALMRRMAREGYAPSQVQTLWSAHQRARYAQYVESYKSTLVWS